MDRVTLSEARAAVTHAVAAGTAPFGLPAALVFEHGTMELFLYQPRGHDRQPPHDQDELYVVMRGSGVFAIGEDEASMERKPFEPGETIFVPAGMPHRFEDVTDDFETWVVMYGPEGGEAEDQRVALQ